MIRNNTKRSCFRKDERTERGLIPRDRLQREITQPFDINTQLRDVCSYPFV